MDVSDTMALYDTSAGIVAHGLLNTMTVISGAAELLHREWDNISPDRRAELFRLIEVHSAEAAQALVTIVQGLPPEVLDLLEELNRRRDEGDDAAAPPPRLRRRRTDASRPGSPSTA